MILMALDHTRDYFSNAHFNPLDLSQTTTALFLTRWITHFCAPVFAFTAGLGAWFRLERTGDRRDLATRIFRVNYWIVLPVIPIVLGAAPLGSAGPAMALAAAASVSITAAGFAPATLTITVGECVTWTNADTTNHAVISTGSPTFTGSGTLRPGESFTATFGRVGTYRYTDRGGSPAGTVIVGKPF